MRRAGLIVAVCFLGVSIASASDIHLRFARVTLAEGAVQIEQGATGERMPAERNLPVGENFWVQTADAARAELEFDDGSYVRLGPGSLAEFSDLTRLSTGQGVTLVSVERGTVYATSEPARLDAFLVVAPGLEITFLQGSRVRVHVNPEISRIAVLEGRVRFSSRPAELELREGQTVEVNPADAGRFQLLREVAAAPLDRWNEARDREAAALAAGTRLPMFAAGLGELDAAGKWVDHPQLGKVWQPRAPEGWAPFRVGHWRWYEGLGYTWVASEPWGWLPYHYGRWAYLDGGGWAWVPGKSGQLGSFVSGEAYWVRAAGTAGWGPLAPGDKWPDGQPSLYAPAKANMTFAAYTPGDRLIDPARPPRLAPDALKLAQLIASLPAPQPLPALARQRVTRVGTTRIVPVTADLAFDRNLAQEAQSQIQVIGAEPAQPAVEPAPEPGVTYYNPPAVAPAPPLAPPPPVYVPVYVPEVVVIERGGDAGGHRRQPAPEAPTPRHPPVTSLAPRPSAPPAPTPAPGPAPERDHVREKAADGEGPEHRTQPRNPESGDAATRRR